MQVHKNELYVSRGETFTLRKKLINRDNSPYIVSSKLKNPYWLITVASSLYEQESRYCINKWLDLSKYKRFLFTKAIDIRNVPTGEGHTDYDGFDTAVIPVGYEGDKSLGYADVAVFYCENSDGTYSYKYWKYTDTAINKDGDYSGSWEDYECILNSLFVNTITNDWIEGTYYYSIYLVSGVSTEEYLQETAKALELDAEGTIEDLYNRISKVLPDVFNDFKIFERPLVRIDAAYPILEHTKMFVSSNVKGGMLI